MVSKSTRNHVWQGLLDMVRYERYYGKLETRYRRKHQWVRFALGAAGVLTALPLLNLIPPIVSSIGGLAVVGLIIWDLVYDYGKRLSALRVAVEGLSELVDRHRTLWDETNTGSVDDATAREKKEELHQAALNLVRGMNGIRDDDLNDQCQEETYQLENERYAEG